MNNTDVYSQLWHRLLPLYDKEEAVAIARLVLDTLFQLSLTDIVPTSCLWLTVNVSMT
mgnify:CR=1 FL=1